MYARATASSTAIYAAGGAGRPGPVWCDAAQRGGELGLAPDNGGAAREKPHAQHAPRVVAIERSQSRYAQRKVASPNEPARSMPIRMASA